MTYRKENALERLGIETLDRIAEPVPARSRRRISKRMEERNFHLASAAIAAKIERQLRVRGISRVELAERLGVTPACITRYLSGKANLQLKTLVDIEEAIDVHIIDRDIIPRVRHAAEVQIITIPESYRAPRFEPDREQRYGGYALFEAVASLACEKEEEYSEFIEYA